MEQKYQIKSDLNCGQGAHKLLAGQWHMEASAQLSLMCAPHRCATHCPLRRSRQNIALIMTTCDMAVAHRLPQYEMRYARGHYHDLSATRLLAAIGCQKYRSDSRRTSHAVEHYQSDRASLPAQGARGCP